VLNESQLLFNGCATPVDFTNDSERWLLEEVEVDLRSGLAASHFRNGFEGIETIAVLAVTRNGCEGAQSSQVVSAVRYPSGSLGDPSVRSRDEK
jgi:hypothetical protein